MIAGLDEGSSLTQQGRSVDGRGRDAAVEGELVGGAGRGGIEGHGPDEAPLFGGEDVGEPGRLGASLDGREGGVPAQRVVLVDAQRLRSSSGQVGDARIEDGVVVGDVEIPAVSPVGAPAVFHDPGPVAGGRGVEVGRAIGIVPADERHGMVGSASGESLSVVLGDIGGLGGVVPVGVVGHVAAHGVDGVDAHGEGPVGHEGLLRRVGGDLGVPSGEGEVEGPIEEERLGGLFHLGHGQGFHVGVGVDGRVGDVGLEGDARSPGQESRGRSVVASSVVEGKGDGSAVVDGAVVSESGQVRSLLDEGEGGQVPFREIESLSRGLEPRRFQRGHGGEGPAGAEGSLVADGRALAPFPQIVAGGEVGGLPKGRLGPGAEMAQVEGRRAVAARGRPLSGSGRAGLSRDEGRVRGGPARLQGGGRKEDDEGDEDDEKAVMSGTVS